MKQSTETMKEGEEEEEEEEEEGKAEHISVKCL
jgi:hypothetical protein